MELFVPIGVFAYHTTPFDRKDYDPNYYNFRQHASTKAISSEPIEYTFDLSILALDSSEEMDAELINEGDTFIVGFENMLFFNELQNASHQVVFMEQNSDGNGVEIDLNAPYPEQEEFKRMDLLKDIHFPEAEFIFHATEEPNEDDIESLRQMLETHTKAGRC